MFSCFHVTKLHESISFHVFSPFNAHFSPKNDVMVNGPLTEVFVTAIGSLTSFMNKPITVTFSVVVNYHNNGILWIHHDS